MSYNSGVAQARGFFFVPLTYAPVYRLQEKFANAADHDTDSSFSDVFALDHVIWDAGV